MPVRKLCYDFYNPGHGHWADAAWLLTFPQVFGEISGTTINYVPRKDLIEGAGRNNNSKKMDKKQGKGSCETTGAPARYESPLWIQGSAFGCCYENDIYTKYPNFRDMLFRGAEFLQFPPHSDAAASSQFPWKVGSPK